MNNLGIFNASQGVSVGFKPKHTEQDLEIMVLKIKIETYLVGAMATFAEDKNLTPHQTMRHLIIKGLEAEGIAL